ncbi:MAG: 1,4-beta-glucanase [Oscillospiraceae bacterium]|nr:1,4-beta-glucanase [Oscillospiraceae bacterium]
MKRTALRHLLAALTAVSLLGAAVPLTGTVSAAATKDISDTMTWGTLRIGGGGFVSGIVTGKKVMYARTDVGGAYRYNYDTEAWEQLFGFITDADRGLLSVDAMAIDPTDDNTVYFLCGCAYFSSEKTVVFKTTDGGKTFKEINITNLIKVMGNGDGRQFGESIAVDPDNPKIIYAGGDVTSDENSKSALIKSTDGGETWAPVIGYDDLGLFSETTLWPTWTENVARCTMKGAYQTQNGVSAIAITGGKVYVATAKSGVANVHVADVKSDKFTALSKDLPTEYYPSRINVDPSGRLLISYMAGLAFQGTAGGGYRYDPKAGTVEKFDLEGGYGSIWADPSNPDHMIAGTCGCWKDQEWEPWTEEHGPAWGDQYFRSFDGGKTWENFTPGKTKGWNQPLISNYLQDGGYAWIRDKAIHWSGTVVTDPRNPDRMFITSGNGVFICTNLWSQDEDNLPTFTFHPDGIEEVVSLDFTSTPDGLNLSAIGDYDGFVHDDVYSIPPQYNPNMGSTSAIAVCPQDTNVWARTANGDGNNTGSAFYTLDRGKTWTPFTPAATGGKLSITMLSKGKYRILNSSASGGVSYSDDLGKTWSKCEGISASKTVYTLVDPNDASIVYASGVQHNDYWASDISKKEPTLEESHYGFFISKDYGKTFTGQTICRYDMCDSTGDPAYITKDTIAMAAGWEGMYILTDGASKAEKLDTVFYAKTVGYGAPEKTGGINTLYMYGKPQETDPEGIYRSTDAGKTWVCINTDHLYGGTGNGNYLCGDMSTFGKVYMSTVGCGIVYGEITGTSKPPVTTATTATTKKTTTTTTAKTESSASTSTNKDKTTETGAKNTVWGDANCDGEIDVSDAVLVARFAAEDKTVQITAEGKQNADVSHNGNIDADDTLQILRYISKLITAADLAPKA